MEGAYDQSPDLWRFETEMFSKRRNNMPPVVANRTAKFSEASIMEVDAINFSPSEQIDEQVFLIESFSQPFPTRERGSPVIDGEMDSYG
jgi:hypothetical protein